ncbi:MAG TPA: DUF805 domain-containing protein [Rhizomicrobium sp.]|jgi:uncharacterized membrane protein YhaH (DUF805 family)|nr:DUF805 domain-containing protein [Rhizomicrobium sp.]
MGLAHYLFGFSGRINRAKQWAILLVGLTAEFLGVIAFMAIVGFGTMGTMIDKQTSFAAVVATPQMQTFFLAACLLYLAVLYISIAVMTKRLHDRNKSGWWVLVFFVLPLVFSVPRFAEMFTIFSHLNDFVKAAANHAGQPPFTESPLAILGGGAAAIINLWAFVELFCLRGTAGDNRFGPDPLAV